MKTDTAPKYWEKTRLNNMVRHTNGRYYARLYRNGKEIWKSLKTAHFSVAESKLAALQKEHREHHAEIHPGNAKMTFGEVAALHLKRVDDRVSIKRRTKQYWRETLEALYRFWKDLPRKEIRRITPEVLREFVVPYADRTSENRYNNTVSLLRHVFDVAIELAIMHTNPAEKLERVTVHGKKLELPTLAKFKEFIAGMRSAHSRDSKNCADLTEGLAYTGIRIGESWHVTIADVMLEKDRLRVVGDPDEATKNGEIRFVPLIPQAKELFQRMLSARPDAKPNDNLFLVRDCEKSMTRAAKEVGMARITHHDLRHFFATVCIENGVDIPSVSRWLGHKDGGYLAMKTYGHLRDEHSTAQAQKVSFEPIASAA